MSRGKAVRYIVRELRPYECPRAVRDALAGVFRPVWDVLAGANQRQLAAEFEP